MKGLTVAVFVVFGLVISSSPIKAGDTPTPSPITSPTPTPAASPSATDLPRLGYIQPVGSPKSDQPVEDEFANDIARQLSEAVPVSIVRLTGGDLNDALKASTCAPLHLVGYVTSEIDEEYGRNAGAQTMIRVVDCAGHTFYKVVGSYAERRNRAIMMRDQLDVVQAKADSAAAADVLDFKSGHEAAWDRFVRTGSVDPSSGATPSAATPATPSPRASGV